MTIPEALKKLTRQFHQDVFLTETTMDGLMAYATEALTRPEAADAKAFLDALLDGSRTPAQIRLIWEALPKDIRIDDDEEMITFLATIRDKLATV